MVLLVQVQLSQVADAPHLKLKTLYVEQGAMGRSFLLDTVRHISSYLYFLSGLARKPLHSSGPVFVRAGYKSLHFN